ncbi:MAG TPA: hypothetical protein VK590_13415 [Saprospiraceae bacterium]|nr:hypothetical protein [Saprospiraceae bacterium]
MKTILKSSLLICFLIIVSCKKDCTPPPIEQNIVGNWNAVVSFNGTTKAGGVMFHADHTGYSPGEIFESSVNGGPVMKDFEWSIEGDTSLGIKYGGTGASFTFFYKILKNSCDNIKVDYFVTDLNLYRN